MFPIQLSDHATLSEPVIQPDRAIPIIKRSAKIVLISPYSQISSIGLRILSSCLKEAGFETRMIFLPDIQEMIAGAEYSERCVPAPALQQIVDLCADAALIGVTVMTSSFRLASQLSDAIRAEHATPVIWGGIHPTVRAEECLRHADLVCIGEGEGMMVEIATRLDEGRPYHDIQNLAYRNAQGELVFNPMLPLVKDLDALPLPDYDYDDHYVLHEGAMARFTPALNGAFSNGQARLTIHATTWAARSYPALPASSSALAAR